MAAYQLRTSLIRREALAPGLVRLALEAPQIAACANPGQFIMVKASDRGDPLLRRPFSIHQVTADGLIYILIKVVGRGTSYLAQCRENELLEVVGPLGHGFSLNAQGGNVCVVGGGVGAAPLFFLVKKLVGSMAPNQVKVLLGSSTANELKTLINDFAKLGTIPFLATDDGSIGHHGFVTDLLSDQFGMEGINQVYACGPEPMMHKVAQLCKDRNCPCQVSLETVMACGISACLGCTIKSSAEVLQSSGRPYLHVCKDGPVFNAGDVAWI